MRIQGLLRQNGPGEPHDGRFADRSDGGIIHVTSDEMTSGSSGNGGRAGYGGHATDDSSAGGVGGNGGNIH